VTSTRTRDSSSHGRTDGSVLPDRFSELFDKYVASSGHPRIRLHDLRHTHATLALAAGVHPKVVSEYLGHATVMPALHEEAADRVAAFVFGAIRG
jgi:integrase